MLIDSTRCVAAQGSDPDADGTTITLTIDGQAYSLEWHRTQIHRRAQHGCVLCPPTPCPCGFDGSLCPGYFEHRRNDAGAEIASWRAA